MSEALKLDHQHSTELDIFLNWVQLAFAQRLPALLGRSSDELSLKLEKTSNENPKEYWATSILIAAEGLTVRMSLLFRTINLRDIIPSPDGMIQDEIKEFHVDFMKEYCNQTAGFLKTELEKVGIHAAISIPIRYRCLDLIFAKLRFGEVKGTYVAEINGDSCFHLQVGVEAHQGLVEKLHSLEAPSNSHSGDADIELF